MSKLISVITAVYNDELFIRKSVESILNQTFTDFEYIIVDDGSTDKTLEILNDLKKTDNRIIVLTQKNKGAAAARNYGINYASGLYIALQDSDDISLPERLETQLQQLSQSDGNLISCTSHKIIDMDDNVIALSNKKYKDINQNIKSGRLCFCTPSMMIHRQALIDIGGYNPFYNKSEDFDLILKLLERKKYLLKINTCLYQYRIRENSEGSKNNGAFVTRALQNYKNRLAGIPEDFSLVINDFKADKNYIFKRTAGEIFYSENYAQYRKLYLKNFYRLPVNNYFLFFIYAMLPAFMKKAIKTVR